MLPATDNLSLYRGDTVREPRYVGRAVKVVTTAGDATVTLASDHAGPGFAETDEGLTIDGKGILEGTTILSYTSATTVELSAPAIAAATITASIRSYDLTGCTPTAQMRVSTTSTAVLYTLMCSLTDQDTDPGGVIMEIAAGATADAPAKAGFDWQLEFADGKVRTLGKGAVKFSGEYTKPVA
jgi:hypothetical protein